MLSSYHITEENIDIYIENLNSYRPKFIHTYPSSIYLIARIMEKLNKALDFKPMAILCGSENLYPQHVDFIEKVFCTNVIGLYGHAERVILAKREKSGEYSFLESYGIAELLDDDGKTVDNGTGTLCGTSLNNRVMPLVRYMTDDIATKTHGDGSGLVVKNIDGRRHEFVYSAADRPVSMTAINIHSSEFDSIERFQFVQKEAGFLSFEYTARNKLAHGAEQAIKNLLLAKLGDGFDLQICWVDKIPLSRSGKQSFLRQGIKQIK